MDILAKKSQLNYTTCFSDFLLDMLELHDITKSELARRLKVSPQVLSKIFNHTRPATLDMAIRIATAFGEDVNAFVYWAVKEEVSRAYKKNNIHIKKVKSLFNKTA